MTTSIALSLTVGCAHSVEPARVAALPRGADTHAVTRTVGDPNVFEFDIDQNGVRYTCVQYSIGRRGEPYYFIYCNGVLEKVVKTPDFFRTGTINANEPPPHPAYLMQRATQILALPDVPAPEPTNPPPEHHPEDAQLIGWVIAMAPIALINLPILVPVYLLTDVPQAVQFDPHRVALGESIDAAEKAFGPARQTWHDSQTTEWRRYEPSGFSIFRTPRVIHVLSVDGRIRAIFGPDLLDDTGRPR